MPSFERDSFIFSFCLPFYVCLYELDKIVAFSNLGKRAPCRLCVTGGFGRQVGARQVLKGPGAALGGEARCPADPACSLSWAMCLGTHYSDLSRRPEHLDRAPPTSGHPQWCSPALEAGRIPTMPRDPEEPRPGLQPRSGLLSESGACRSDRCVGSTGWVVLGHGNGHALTLPGALACGEEPLVCALCQRQKAPGEAAVRALPGSCMSAGAPNRAPTCPSQVQGK